jgi:signal peptidase
MKRRSVLNFIVSATCFFSVILIAAAMSISLLIIAQRIFEPFHVVVSNSMAPQISKGDAVMIKDIEPNNVKVGQVIVFRDPEQKDEMIIHRVVAVEPSGQAILFTTKGDNNPVDDDWRVSTGEIVGAVGLHVPRFGSFVAFISTSRGYFSCVAIPGAVALALVFLLGIGETAEKRRPKLVRQMACPPRPKFDPKPTAGDS